MLNTLLTLISILLLSILSLGVAFLLSYRQSRTPPRDSQHPYSPSASELSEVVKAIFGDDEKPLPHSIEEEEYVREVNELRKRGLLFDPRNWMIQ